MYDYRTLICLKCGKLRRVRVWPLRCSCGMWYADADDPGIDMQPSHGLGDCVAAVISKLGIKPCGGCKRRQVWLNRVGDRVREALIWLHPR